MLPSIQPKWVKLCFLGQDLGAAAHGGRPLLEVLEERGWVRQRSRLWPGRWMQNTIALEVIGEEA
jgi:hypothetical protein